MSIRTILVSTLLILLLGSPVALSWFLGRQAQTRPIVPPGREEVVFWHFWGGQDRDVVEDVVQRFNEAQSSYWVRPIAMPGNNLQAKLFLSVAGGDPPDLVNQDDPILADWAERGVIQPLDEFGGVEVKKMGDWMFESARRLSTYNNQFFGVCNGLDIRAMYYNKTALQQYGLSPPETIEGLDRVANTVSPANEAHERYAYLPDSRRFWAWGFVYGGGFFDPQTYQANVDSQPLVECLRWMQSYGRIYGPDNLAAFRQGDQSLPGKTFPLLPIEADSVVGRYCLIMDGQWRVRDIVNFQNKRRKAGIAYPEYGVCPLPTTSGGRKNAGWVNGNFFVVPSGARNSTGAWEFIKFWIGFNQESQAAKTCAAGGWIPVSQSVVDDPLFQAYLDKNPMFAKFVELAGSPNQFPIPQVPGAAFFKRTIEAAGYEAMNNPEKSAVEILKTANERIQKHLDRAREDLKLNEERP